MPVESNLVIAARKAHYRYEIGTKSGDFVPQIGAPGEVFLIQAGQLPHIRIHTPVEFMYCRLSPELLDDARDGLHLSPSLPQRTYTRITDQASHRIMSLLADEMHTRASSGSLYAESLAQALAIRFLRADEPPQRRLRPRTSELPPRILRRVRDKMDSSLHSNLSLAAIAAESGYSRTHFFRMFRASTGMTPHRYLIALRIDRVKTLLANRNANLIDVAAVCGFSSQAHMTTVFHRMVGLTPAEFRRDVLPCRRNLKS